MKSQRLRGVIFDMDGVLVDSQAVHRRAWRLFFQTLGRDVPEPELDFILDGRKRGDILRHFLGHCSDPELEEFGRAERQYLPPNAVRERPRFPGVVRYGARAPSQWRRTGPVDLASRSRARSTLAELGLMNCFAEVVTGEDVLLGKPDPGVYRLACQRMGIASESLLAVEDAISGIRAAIGAGLRWSESRCMRPESLTSGRRGHVVQDFETVSLHELECLLRDPIPRDAVAAGSG